jgi:hypothetical protein
MTKMRDEIGNSRGVVPRYCRLLSDIEKELAALSRDASAGTIQRNLALVRSLGLRHQCAPLLREVLCDASLLDLVASRSYRHVNHFDKIVLIANDDLQGYRLTLHLWDPPYSASELEDELIHAHRFSFWSTILTGTLVSQNYVHAANGQLFRQYRYIPEKRARDFSDFYQFRGTVTLAKSDPDVKGTGDTYYLAAPSIHRIELPIARTTCSMVLRGPRLQNYSNVFNTSYPKSDSSFDNVMFTPQQLARRLEKLLRLLDTDTDAYSLADVAAKRRERRTVSSSAFGDEVADAAQTQGKQ